MTTVLEANDALDLAREASQKAHAQMQAAEKRWLAAAAAYIVRSTCPGHTQAREAKTPARDAKTALYAASAAWKAAEVEWARLEARLSEVTRERRDAIVASATLDPERTLR